MAPKMTSTIWCYDLVIISTRCGLLDRTCKALVRKLWGGRVSRAGKRVQPIDGRTRNPRVLLYRLRFVSRFGKLGPHNNTGIARTKAKDSAPNSQQHPSKFDEKSIESRRKTKPNRREIVQKSLSGGFGRSKPFRGRAGTRSGRLVDGQMPPKGRS